MNNMKSDFVKQKKRFILSRFRGQRKSNAIYRYKNTAMWSVQFDGCVIQ